MAHRFYSDRDIKTFDKFNKELIDDVIGQKCILYKLELSETKTNVYGEAEGGKNYKKGIELPCLIDWFNVDYSVQIARVNPLSIEGIFYIKEVVLSGGSIGNDFNFPCDSEHTTHFLLFKYKEIV